MKPAAALSNALPRLRPLLALLALLALCGAAPAASDVWVVAASGHPPGDFLEVQPALDAAADGDVILVRRVGGHTYAGFTVLDKSVAIVGDPEPLNPQDPNPFAPAFDPVVREVEVHGNAPHQWVVIRHFDVLGVAPSTRPTFFVHDAFGPVWLEDSFVVRNENFTPAPIATPAVAFTDVVSAVVLRTRVEGEPGFLGTDGGLALNAFRSSSFLYDSLLLGGDGSFALPPAPGQPILQATPGGAGLLLADGSLYAAASDVIGGQGGKGTSDPIFTCYPSAGGGEGARLVQVGQRPRLVLHDTEPAGGPGGDAVNGLCGAGPGGPDLIQGSGRVRRSSSSTRTLRVVSPVREGQPIHLRVRGVPGEEVILVRGTPATGDLRAGRGGARHLDPVVWERSLGVLSPLGGLTVQLPSGELPPGEEASVMHLQALFVSAGSGRVSWSNPETLVVLDASL